MSANGPLFSTIGTSVADGLSPARLRFGSLDTDYIMVQVRTQKAIIVARIDGKVVYYLNPEGLLLPTNDLDAARICQLFVNITG